MTTVSEIIKVVAANYAVSVSDVCSDSKDRQHVRARYHAAQLAYQHGHGVNKIARAMGISANTAGRAVRKADEYPLKPIREVLPTRRRVTQRDVEWKGQRFTVGVGVNARHDPMEVFADGEKSTSDMSMTVQDACIIASLALQHGCPPELLVKSLGKVPVPVGDEVGEAPASPIGAIMAMVVEEADGV